MSEHVGRIYVAMVRCMTTDSALSKFLWEKLIATAAFLGIRAPHSKIGIQSPCELHGAKLDLGRLHAISARAVM